MAKSKTVWEWRGKTFGSKEQLLKHLRERARAAVDPVIGPPAKEVSGRDRCSHWPRVKVIVSLGARPRRARREPSASAPAPQAVARPKARSPKPPSKAGIDREVAKYFG